MKSNISSLCFAIISSLLLANNVFSQVSKYEKIEKVGDKSFNFVNDRKKTVKLKKDRNIKVVYSDRSNNKTYLDPFFQLNGISQEFLTPYFVVGSSDDAYEVVIADSTLIGKPKSIFAFLMNKKYHFNDSKAVQYVGWIPKDYVLNYKTSYISEVNNKPLKYKIGIDNIEGLYELNRTFKGDSIHIFRDPFLEHRSAKKMGLNQTVYPFKYNHTRTAVLISNRPTIADTINNVIGWMPADLITPIGQGYVYDLEKQNDTLTTDGCENLQLQRNEIHDRYLYETALNKPVYTKDSEVSIPIYVWDHKLNKLINVKGNDILITEAQRLKRESKAVNFHFIFNENEMLFAKPLINSLQNLGVFFTDHKDLHYSFSAVFIAKEGSYVFPKTKSFAKWLNFIINSVENGSRQEELLVEDILDLSQAIKTSMAQNLDAGKNFENNLFILANSHNVHYLHRQEDLLKEMALRSSKLLFVQLENKTGNKYQNNILLAKEALSKTEVYYNEFIENYIIENDLIVAKGSLKNIESDISNVYIYNAPDESLFNGGIVFPSIDKSIDAQALSVAMDTLLVNSLNTNKKLISSLYKYEMELGVLRSEPSGFLRCLFKEDSLSLERINRNNPNDVYYEKVQLGSTITNTFKKGYAMSREELIALIENYRVLMPRFPRFKLPKIAESNLPSGGSGDLDELGGIYKAKRKMTLTRRNKWRLKRTYKKQIRGINKSFKRKVIRKRDNLATLYFYKTGLRAKDDFNAFIPSHVKTIKAMKNGFDEFYIKNVNKVDVLEKKFLDGQLQMIDENTYFVPKELLL